MSSMRIFARFPESSAHFSGSVWRSDKTVDQRIFRLLLATGFSLEKTKQKIDNLLTACSLVPEMLMDRDPCAKSMNTVRQYMEYTIIPQRLDDTTRITIFSYKGKDFSNANMFDYFKLCFMAYEYVLSSDLCLGEHYIIDWKGVKLGHITQVTAGAMKKVLFILRRCYGAKVKSVHYTNVPQYAEIVVSILKACSSEKIGSRLHVHKDYNGLYNFFPRNILPSDFGGDNKSLTEFTDDLLAQMVKRREWFIKQGRYKSDETKRVGVGSALSKDLQGMQGSFRTLDID